MLKKFFGASLVRHNAVMFLGGLLTGGVNYLLYPVMSRFLSITEFGEVQILFSLVLQIGIISAVIKVFVINVLADEDRPEVIAQFLRNTRTTLYYLSLALSIILLALSPVLKNVLQFESVWGLVPAALSSIFGMQFVIHVAYLQSRQRFNDVSVMSLIQAVLKLILATGFAAIGLGAGGVVWGLVLSSVIALVIVSSQSKEAFRGPAASTHNSKPEFAGRALLAHVKPLSAIGVTTLTLFVVMSIDTFFAKAHFSPTDAGLYAGVAVVARTLFYLTGTIAGVLLASVKPAMAKGAVFRSYVGSILILCIIGLPAVLFMTYLDNQTVRILVGADYVAYSNLLPTLALTMFVVGLINLVINFHIAMKDYLIIIPSLAGIAMVTALMSYSHSSLEELANSFLYGAIIWLIVTTAWTVFWSLKYQPEVKAT